MINLKKYFFVFNLPVFMNFFMRPHLYLNFKTFIVVCASDNGIGENFNYFYSSMQAESATNQDSIETIDENNQNLNIKDSDDFKEESDDIDDDLEKYLVSMDDSVSVHNDIQSSSQVIKEFENLTSKTITDVKFQCAKTDSGSKLDFLQASDVEDFFLSLNAEDQVSINKNNDQKILGEKCHPLIPSDETTTSNFNNAQKEGNKIRKKKDNTNKERLRSEFSLRKGKVNSKKKEVEPSNQKVIKNTQVARFKNKKKSDFTEQKKTEIQLENSYLLNKPNVSPVKPVMVKKCKNLEKSLYEKIYNVVESKIRSWVEWGYNYLDNNNEVSLAKFKESLLIIRFDCVEINGIIYNIDKTEDSLLKEFCADNKKFINFFIKEVDDFVKEKFKIKKIVAEIHINPKKKVFYSKRSKKRNNRIYTVKNNIISKTVYFMPGNMYKRLLFDIKVLIYFLINKLYKKFWSNLQIDDLYKLYFYEYVISIHKLVIFFQHKKDNDYSKAFCRSIVYYRIQILYFDSKADSAQITLDGCITSMHLTVVLFFLNSTVNIQKCYQKIEFPSDLIKKGRTTNLYCFATRYISDGMYRYNMLELKPSSIYYMIFNYNLVFNHFLITDEKYTYVKLITKINKLEKE